MITKKKSWSGGQISSGNSDQHSAVESIVSGLSCKIRVSPEVAAIEFVGSSLEDYNMLHDLKKTQIHK